MKRIDDKTVINAYRKYGNIWKAGEAIGLSGQSVQVRLKKLGINRKNRPLSEREKAKIIAVYQSEIIHGDNKLKRLSEEIGRTIPFISRFAGSVGLTSYSRTMTDDLRANVSVSTKKYIEKNGHPRGSLGHKVSNEQKKERSERLKSLWKDKGSYFNTDAYRQKLSDRMSRAMVERMSGLSKGKIYSRAKKGWIECGGKRIFCRSKWEMNYARYLEFLKSINNIRDWDYETTTFWFEKIKRGVRSYKPDFQVTLLDGTTEFHEVKGWMDARSQTKINRMRIYYPNIKLIIIDQKCYKSISECSRLIAGWED